MVLAVVMIGKGFADDMQGVLSQPRIGKKTLWICSTTNLISNSNLMFSAVDVTMDIAKSVAGVRNKNISRPPVHKCLRNEKQRVSM